MVGTVSPTIIVHMKMDEIIKNNELYKQINTIVITSGRENVSLNGVMLDTVNFS